MRNTVKMLIWGVIGLTLTGALSYGAFAIAGNRLSTPAAPLNLVVPRLVASPSTQRSADPKPSHHRSPSHTPSAPVTQVPSSSAYQPPTQAPTSAPAPRPTDTHSSHEHEPHDGGDD